MSIVEFGELGYYEEDRRTERRGDSGWGQRTFICPYELRNGDWLPVINVSRYTDGLGWPPCWEDNLIATSIKSEFFGARQVDQEPQNSDFSYCRQIVEYNTIPAITGWKVESRGKREFVEMGIARHWSDGSPSDQSLAIPIYVEEISASRIYLFSTARLQKFRAAQNCVNSTTFSAPWGEVFAPGTLLLQSFDRYHVDNEYYGTMLHITFHFLASENGFERVWRLPPVMRNPDGSIYYDENFLPVYEGTPGWDSFQEPLFGTYA